MLRTRLWMGALLIGLVVAALAVDPAPFYPLWLVLVLLLSLLGGYELWQLLASAHGRSSLPALWICQASVALLILANWPAHLGPLSPSGKASEPCAWILGAFTATVLVGFLVEMATFREPGTSIVRMAFLIWLVSYLGLLPSFLAQLRWLDQTRPETAPGTARLALGLAIFVPKCCDIGAYFTGRLLGRHRMSPVLSPKKTWEGAAGGTLTAVAAAVAIHWAGPVLSSTASAIGFGIVVGAAGMLGDLAESLIKRDCRQKDASHVVPGFGGVLDVVDAILFSAPVSYWWIQVG